MKKIKRIFLVLVIVIIVPVIVAISYIHNVSSPLSANDKEYLVTIAKGENIDIISQKLVDAKIIKSAFYFKLYSRLHGLSAQIKAGSYSLSSALSPAKIIGILTQGDVVNREREIKIIPGWNLQDIENYLIKNNIISIEDFKKISSLKVGEWNLGFDKPAFLNDAPAGAGLEGYLFPDTYRIFADAKAEDIVHKLLVNFNDKLTEQMRVDIASQGKSIYDVITMASIIEKEVNNLEDMEIVSGIFWKRVDNNYPLESCATLAYILGENKKQYSLEDTQIDSSYNTYRNKGLPPGPICNPGLAAIKAAVYPKASPYHYFLSRFDTGETVFSKTYEEHLQNKAKYLK